MSSSYKMHLEFTIHIALMIQKSGCIQRNKNVAKSTHRHLVHKRLHHHVYAMLQTDICVFIHLHVIFILIIMLNVHCAVCTVHCSACIGLFLFVKFELYFYDKDDSVNACVESNLIIHFIRLKDSTRLTLSTF